MPVSTEPSSSSSTTIGQHIRLHRHKNRTLQPPFPSTDEPLIPKPNRPSKSAMSSFFLLPSSSSSSTGSKKPNSFSQTTSFRGLGCTTSASQQVSVPAVIRSSADWDSTGFKIKKTKKSKKKKSNNDNGSVKILSESDRTGTGCVAIPDVWCGPGVGFSTDAVVGTGSIDPVESIPVPPRRNIPTRRKIDVDNNNSNHIEGSSVLPKQSVNQESDTYFDSDSSFLTSRVRSEQTLFSDRYHRHLRHPYHDGLSEIMMMQNGFVMGGTLSSNDHFRDMRLNVDNMTYEQLLELGDRIGYVNTGLTEKQIKLCIRKARPLRSDTAHDDKKCSICQDEYEAKDEIGKLRCDHKFHVHCVKQWLLRKNNCPVCKTVSYLKS